MITIGSIALLATTVGSGPALKPGPSISARIAARDYKVYGIVYWKGK